MIRARVSSFFSLSSVRGSVPSLPLARLHTRRVSDSIPPGWEDTVAAPFDPLRESDLGDQPDLMVRRYEATMPMGLPLR